MMWHIPTVAHQSQDNRHTNRPTCQLIAEGCAQCSLATLNGDGTGARICRGQCAADDQYTTEDLATDVVTFIELMDLGIVDIVGASWGGLVGLAVAAQLPGTVGRLVMIDIPPSFPASQRDFRQHPRSYANHQDVFDYIQGNNSHAREKIVEVMAANAVRPGESGRLYVKHDGYFHDHRPHKADDLGESRIPPHTDPVCPRRRERFRIRPRS